MALIAIVDDWFLRPRPAPRGAAGSGADPPLAARASTLLLPVLLIAGACCSCCGSERLDFSLVLVLVVAGRRRWSGLLDQLLLAPARARAAAARAGVDPAAQPLPVTVDYARSFLPVALVVLVLRSFIFEPFRIPSDSMMPTLLDGDFIVVNKFAYGLRLPVLNTKIVRIGEPQRGDVVVFRYPPDPAINYIKRLVGLPGDRVRVQRRPAHHQRRAGAAGGRRRATTTAATLNMRLPTEQLGTHSHQALSCRSPDDLMAPPVAELQPQTSSSSYVSATTPDAARCADRDDYRRGSVVPPGSYLMIGDNRDNSADGRFWGFVPEDHLVGRAAGIWFNLGLAAFRLARLEPDRPAASTDVKPQGKERDMRKYAARRHVHRLAVPAGAAGRGASTPASA